MARRFVIGDVHGCFDTLYKLLFSELKIDKSDEIYLLGDYIDRGPQSKKVLNLLMKMKEENWQIFPILGNHEDMMINYAAAQNNIEDWYSVGGKKTLKSFNVKHPDDIPVRYFEYLKNLPLYYELEDFIIVHAGLNFENDDIFADKYSMLWTRSINYDAGKAKGKRLIIGHTPYEIEKIQDTLEKDIVCIDGGCAMTWYPCLGKLCALELNSMELIYIDCIDDI